MSILGRKFNKIAKPEAKKADYPPPFSIRFTFEERAWMDAERGDKSLSAYIRERLFGANAAPCRPSRRLEGVSAMRLAILEH